MPKIPQLPHEIIIQIISRLPVKSLMRFKCVSKPWRSLISSPEFAKERLKQSKQVCNTDCHKICVLADPPLCVDQEAYCDGDEEKLLASQLSLPLNEPITYAEIVGSCDGLICAAFEEEKFILVWNPSTRESRQLPMPNSSASGIAMPRIFYGFGYDLHVDDYKIISGSITPGSNEPKVDAFALKTDEWKRIEDPNCNVVLEGSGAFCNGLLHWLSSQGNNDQQKTYGIVSFDLAQEKFVEMVPLPNQIDQSCLRTDNLIALGNLLCVYCDGPDFEVWAAKEYGTQACCWTRLVRFSSEVLPGYKYWLKFVSITKNGDVVLEFDGWDLVFYNLESGTLKTFTIENEWDICQATLYLESLVSPQCL